MVIILYLLILWMLFYLLLAGSRAIPRRYLPPAARVCYTRLLSYIDGLDPTTAHPSAFGENSLPRQVIKGAMLLLGLGLLQDTYSLATARTRVSWIIGFVVISASILISTVQFLFGQLPGVRGCAIPAFALKILGALVWCVVIIVVHPPYFMWLIFATFFVALWFEIFRGLRGVRKFSKSSKPESVASVASLAIAMLEAQRLMQEGPEERNDKSFQIGMASSSRAPYQAHRTNAGAFIYEPPHLIARGTSLPCPPDQAKEKELFPLFVRCSCCVSASEIPKMEAAKMSSTISLGRTYLPWKARRRRKKREAFLLSPLTSPAQEFAADVAQLELRPHAICARCEAVCNYSSLLEQKWWVTRGAFKVETSERFALWNTPSELADSAGKGCHLCTLIWTSLSQEQQENLLRADEVVRGEMEGMIRDGGSDQRQLARVREDFCRRRLIWLRLRLIALTADTYPPPIRREIVAHFGGFKVPRLWIPAVRGYGIRKMQMGAEATDPLRIVSLQGGGPTLHPVATSTGSDAALAMVKKWLHLRPRITVGREDLPEQQYNASFDWQYPWNFVKTEFQGFVPLKLLDVASSVSPDIQLINGTDLIQGTTEEVEYIALSYCWGHGDSTRLTKASQQQFQERISLASLGQTIQDAITATRRLGYRYLWVDALCILQDSNIEPISMCDVYNNAVCTIAAVKSWTVSESISQWYAQSISNTVALSWQRDVTMSRWNTRGWCYQEMVLSNIIIFFGSSQVHASVREPHHHGWRRFSTTSTPNDHHYKFDKVLKTEQAWDNLEVEKINEASYLSRVWWDHVGEYSPRNLTNASDKMVAIAGIAEYMWKCGLKSHYIAGLWEDTLPRDLLWYVSAGIRNKRPDGPRGPSWSWASVDGAILHDSPECWSSNCGLQVQGITFDDGSGEERIGSGKWHIGVGRKMTIDSTEIAIPLEQLTPPRPSLRHRLTRLRAITPGAMKLHVRGKLQRAIWRPHAADATDCFDRHRTAEWRYTTNLHRGDVEYSLTRPEGRPFHFEYYQDFDYLQTVTDNPKDGPRTFALLKANDVETEEVGWFIPDVSENIPRDIYCLQIKLEPEIEEERMNPFSLWLNRGLAVVPIDGSETCFDYRRVGYIELSCEAPRLRYPTIIGFGSRGIEPSRESLNIDPHNFFQDVEERDITLI